MANKLIQPMSFDEIAQVSLYLIELKRIEPVLTAHRAPVEALALSLGAHAKTENELRALQRILELGFLHANQTRFIRG
jgi:hypothetical protein